MAASVRRRQLANEVRRVCVSIASLLVQPETKPNPSHKCDRNRDRNPNPYRGPIPNFTNATKPSAIYIFSEAKHQARSQRRAGVLLTAR